MKVYLYTILALLLALSSHAQNQTPESQTQTTGIQNQTAISQPQNTGIQSQTAITQPETTGIQSQTAAQPQTTSLQSQTATANQPQATASQPQTPPAQTQTAGSLPLTQLIKNGRMEQLSGQSWFFGYYGNQRENPNGYKFEFSIEASASGEYAIKMTGGQVKNDSVYCSLNQSFSPAGIPVGSKVTLKAKIKTVNMVGTGMAVALRGNKLENNLPKTTFFKSTQGYVPITGTNEFEEYSVTVDSYDGNSDSISAFIFYLPKTSGVAFIDDVSVTVDPPAAPAPTTSGKKKKRS